MHCANNDNNWSVICKRQSITAVFEFFLRFANFLVAHSLLALMKEKNNSSIDNFHVKFKKKNLLHTE
jgi:hypothetical protein